MRFCPEILQNQPSRSVKSIWWEIHFKLCEINRLISRIFSCFLNCDGFERSLRLKKVDKSAMRIFVNFNQFFLLLDTRKKFLHQNISTNCSSNNDNSQANVLIIHELVLKGNEMFEITMSLPVVCHWTKNEKKGTSERTLRIFNIKPCWRMTHRTREAEWLLSQRQRQQMDIVLVLFNL